MYVRTYVRHIRLSKWKLRVLLYKKRAGVFLVIFFLLLPWMEKSHLVLARTFFLRWKFENIVVILCRLAALSHSVWSQQKNERVEMTDRQKRERKTT